LKATRAIVDYFLHGSARDRVTATYFGGNQRGLAKEDVKLLSLVDILEPLSREELAKRNWNT
jgi:hypothetical protein